MSEKRKSEMHVYLDAETIAAVQRLALKERRTNTAQAAQLICEAIAARQFADISNALIGGAVIGSEELTFRDFESAVLRNATSGSPAARRWAAAMRGKIRREDSSHGA